MTHPEYHTCLKIGDVIEQMDQISDNIVGEEIYAS